MKLPQFARRLVAPPLFALAASLAALAAPAGVAAQQTPGGSVLFTQVHYGPLGQDDPAGPDATRLSRVKASGGHVTPLTSLVHHVFYNGARWSRNGRAIVYERETWESRSTRSQIHRVDRQGGSHQRLTRGLSRHDNPVWGPGPWVAFVEGGWGVDQCLALVRPNGDNQHILFCPPQSAGLGTPQWSPNGRQLYVEAYYETTGGGLDKPALSDLYRVNVNTGHATLVWRLKSGGGESYASLGELSPDGSRGIYHYDDGRELLINYRTGKSLVIPGSSPRFSPDGRKIAFHRKVDTPDFRDFGAIYVMCADGTDVRRITNTIVPDDFYSVADWSADGSQLLLNRKRNTDQGQSYTIHIIDLKTQRISYVATGTAGKGAWSQP